MPRKLEISESYIISQAAILLDVPQREQMLFVDHGDDAEVQVALVDGPNLPKQLKDFDQFMTGLGFTMVGMDYSEGPVRKYYREERGFTYSEDDKDKTPVRATESPAPPCALAIGKSTTFDHAAAALREALATPPVGLDVQPDEETLLGLCKTDNTCICGHCGRLDDHLGKGGLCSACGADEWVQFKDLRKPGLHKMVWMAFVRLSLRFGTATRRPRTHMDKAAVQTRRFSSSEPNQANTPKGAGISLVELAEQRFQEKPETAPKGVDCCEQWVEGALAAVKERREREQGARPPLPTGYAVGNALAADKEAYKRVLEEFISDIESSGGVLHTGEDDIAPMADREWSDLGETYIRACSVLAREPKIQMQCAGCGEHTPRANMQPVDGQWCCPDCRKEEPTV